MYKDFFFSREQKLESMIQLKPLFVNGIDFQDSGQSRDVNVVGEKKNLDERIFKTEA